MNKKIEHILAALDGFRMSDEMTYSAYTRLHTLISQLNEEPRVLTLYEIQTLPNGDETNAPVVREQRVPVETWDNGTICQWCGARFVQETAEDDWYYGVKNYGKTWRCWTALPTTEQREAAKWDAD